MEEFLRITLSFPTIVFGIALAVLMVLWAVSALGMLEIDALDGLVIPDFDGVDPQGLGGLLLKFGLGGVPLMVVLTVLALSGWVFSYFLQFLLINPIGIGLIRWPLAVLAMVAAFVAAVFATGLVLRPFRHMMVRLAPQDARSVIGLVAVVRSGQVDARHGQVTAEDGGAGLILNARADGDAVFRRGERVVLIEYIDAANAYRVIGENEFNGHPLI